MYTILVNDDNSMTITEKQRIMQRSKLVDNLRFLVLPEYNGHDMTDFTVMVEYILPISKQYRSEILPLSEERYKEHLVFTLPFDTALTQEPGDIEVQLTFGLVDLDPDGNPILKVRKTSSTTVTIVPIKAWSDIIPDSALTAIDQRLIKADAQIKALDELAAAINLNKADSLTYDKANGILQLLSGNKEIGAKVNIDTCTHEGSGNSNIPVVVF